MHDRNYAVIGGGLAGLSSAFQLTRIAPDARITVYDKGTAASYDAGSDTIGRASLSASPARTIRLSGASAGANQWLVQETRAMLEALQADMRADPAAYPGLEGKTLLTPQPAVTIGADRDDALYTRSLDSLKSSGAAYEELDGATLKGRYPHLYRTLPDTAAVLVESPAGPDNAAGVSGVMDVQSTLKALTCYLKKRGADIRYGETVTEVDQGSGHAVVATAKEVRVYEKAIVAPGQWLESVIETPNHGIRLRYDRVVVLDIDLKALGLESRDLPFTKGLAPEGGRGSMYSFLPDPGAGRLKFIPAATVKTVPDAASLKSPLTEEEVTTAVNAAAVVLQVDPEELRKQAYASLCAYTCPKYKENPLVAPLSDNVVVNALDSSGSARTSGGLGRIAASLALGLEEPYPGIYMKHSLEAHHDLVREQPEIKRESVLTRILTTLKQAIGL